MTLDEVLTTYTNDDLNALIKAQEVFDELSRTRGRTSRRTRLTEPAKRRERILEALSWCPAGVCKRQGTT